MIDIECWNIDKTHPAYSRMINEGLCFVERTDDGELLRKTGWMDEGGVDDALYLMRILKEYGFYVNVVVETGYGIEVIK